MGGTGSPIGGTGSPQTVGMGGTGSPRAGMVRNVSLWEHRNAVLSGAPPHGVDRTPQRVRAHGDADLVTGARQPLKDFFQRVPGHPTAVHQQVHRDATDARPLVSVVS